MQTRERKIEAVIFDLDGTLVDSEPLYLIADTKVLADYGVRVDEKAREKYIGTATRRMMEDIQAEFHLDVTVDRLLDERNAYYLELARPRSRVFPEMRKFVRALKGEGLPLAIASGSTREVIDTVLAVTGMRGYFEAAVSSDEVKASKPAPDIFLEAARVLGARPEACVVVEDSRHGVEAARRAGMRCIAVPFQNGGPLHESFALADLLFEKGMGEFRAECAVRWMQNS